MQYQNFNKKIKQTKGTITNIEISELQKNDYVGQNDFYIHNITIENNGEKKEFSLRQITEEVKFEVGTYVSFRYNNYKEFKNPLIEAKSFGKSLSPEELLKFNQNQNKSKTRPRM